MNRSMINLLIDIVAFIGFALLAVTGLILKFMLPAGSGGLLGRGYGVGAAQRPVALLWNMTRHEWGGIHFWIAVVLMAALALHLFLHWRWIACMFTKHPAQQSGLRLALGLLGLAVLAVLAASVFVSPVRKIPRQALLEEVQGTPGEVRK